MANKTFNLTISRVDEPVFTGAALSLTVPGVAGEMVVLAEHEPFISPLTAGSVYYTDANGVEHQLTITSGTLEVAHNHATVLI